MGIQKFQVEIHNNPFLSYFPSQTIFGTLHLVADHDCKNEGIRVKFEGKATVHWTEQRTVTENQGTGRDARTTTRTITEHFSAEEEYFVYNVYLSGSGHSQVTPAGVYKYPFQFTLPVGLPSSFVSKTGKVWYEVEAVMKRSWKKDYRARVPFTVNGILDLNMEPGAAQPMDVRKFKNLCCWCCKSGPIGFVMTVTRKGYVPGEYLRFIAELSNQSTRRVKRVSIQLIQTVTYHSTRKSISHSKIICEARGPAVSPGDSEHWTGNILQIPPIPPTRLANCRIIDIQYSLKLEMDLAGPSINLRQDIPIIIGSIPLQNNFQDIVTLQAPTATGMIPGPSAPPQSDIMFTDQTSFLQTNYPNLPPPTYAETILQDQYDRMGGGDPAAGVNKGYAMQGEGGPPSAPPYAATEETFAPKYLTYAWK